MLRSIFLVLCVSIPLGFQSANAQSGKRYEVSPSDTLAQTAPPEDLTIFDIYQRNVSSEVLQLSWILVSKQIPEGWEYSMCDLGHCYAAFPTKPADMFPADPDEEAFLGLNINPHSIAGTAVVRIYVYDQTAPAAGDTLTWIITSGVASVKNDRAVSASISPNPSQNSSRIIFGEATTGAFQLLDISGVTVKEFKLVDAIQFELDMADLPSGVYLLRSTEAADFKPARIIKL